MNIKTNIVTRYKPYHLITNSKGLQLLKLATVTFLLLWRSFTLAFL